MNETKLRIEIDASTAEWDSEKSIDLTIADIALAIRVFGIPRDRENEVNELRTALRDTNADTNRYRELYWEEMRKFSAFRAVNDPGARHAA